MTFTATPSAGGTFVFSPDADAAVLSNRSGVNFGTAGRLGIDSTPEFISYLRFNVAGLSGEIASATLRVYLRSGNAAFAVAAVADSSWEETTITFSNAPLVGEIISSSGVVNPGSYIEIDITSHIVGEGTITLAIVAVEAGRDTFSSREGENPPQLVIVTD
jgi:hypothetical protein